MVINIIQLIIRETSTMPLTLGHVVERIKQQLEIERERYTRTKFGKLFAFLLYVGMFKVGPIIMQWWNDTFDTPQPHFTFIFIIFSNMIVLSGSFNFVVWALSKLKIPFFEQYRINPNQPWPWEETDPVKAKEAKRVLKYTYIHGGIKYLIVSPLLTYFGAQVQKSPFVTDMTLTPSTMEMLKQMGIMFIVEDIISYILHRAFHHPLLYRFHKEHHEYYYPIPIAAWHFHYVEYFMLQIFTTQCYFVAGMVYAPLHISTIMIWFIFRFWNNNSTHIGYNFPWTPTSLIPFSLNDEFHDFHHTHNVGNYGLYLRIWDSMFGGTKAFREFKAKQKKVLQNKTE